MAGSVGEFAVGCQGQTWPNMLGTRVFRWTGVFRAGIVRWERKGEQARDLLRDGVLSEKSRRTPSRPHVGFRAYGRGPPRIWGRPGTSDY
jgi:hypothetical protein